MKIVITTLLLLVLSTDKQLSEKPLFPNKISLEKKLKLIDEENGFYDRIASTRADNGDYLILDIGNKLVFRYNSKGLFRFSFGKEGNGPGELFRPSQIWAKEGRIIIRDGRRTQLFKADGSFIKELSERFARPSINKDGIHFYFFDSPRIRYSSKHYDFNGKLKSQEENPRYSKENAEQRFQMNSMRMKEMMTRPRDLTAFSGKFIRYYPGEYHVEVLDENHESKIHIKRSFTRQKTLPQSLERMRLRFRRGKGAKERMKQMMATREEITGGYQSDILDIVAVNASYVFLRTATKTNHSADIDVLSKEFDYISKLSIQGDEVLSLTIVDDELLVNFKNEDDGPYLAVYQIKEKK